MSSELDLAVVSSLVFLFLFLLLPPFLFTANDLAH